MVADPSAAPVRERGVHSRAGNAMARTRAAVLDGASRAVEKHGARKATMSDIAALAGVAKGTLYNHFRTKEAVYAAAVDAGIRSLADECDGDDLAGSLATVAERLGSHPALRRVAADEPAVLATLTTVGRDGGWATAREAVRSVLATSGRDSGEPAVEVVLRWLVTFAGCPGADVDRQAALVAAAIPATQMSPEPVAATADQPGWQAGHQ